MRQVCFRRHGDPSVLELRELETPAPGVGEIRVRVAAAGINFADLMARMGLYSGTPPLPAVMGWEVAGSVDAVGAGVAGFEVGQPVVAVCHFGGYATHAIATAEQAVALPEGLDPAEAAAIPVQGLAAWMMIVEMGRVRAGDRVLVHSAGGGVGLLALDLLRWLDARALGTASAAKHETLLELGYDRVVDPAEVDFADAFGDEGGLDLILDPVGGAWWTRDLRLLRGGGRLVCYGYSAAVGSRTRRWLSLLRLLWTTPWLASNPFSLMLHNRGVMGIEMEHLWQEGERVAGWLRRLVELWQQGVLRPRVHARVPLSQAAEAHRMLHDRENLGKVVLVPDGVGAGSDD